MTIRVVIIWVIPAQERAFPDFQRVDHLNESSPEGFSKTNVTNASTIYKYMKRGLKYDTKADFTQLANVVGSYTVGNFTIVISTMIVHIFQNIPTKTRNVT